MRDTALSLRDFLAEYDKPGFVVLLEGKRTVPDEDAPRLTALGELLAKSSEHLLFRSGNASGADDLYAAGVKKVDSARLQLITPYDKHRKAAYEGSDVVSLDSINLAAEPQVVYGSQTHQSTEKLVDEYITGVRNRFTVKAAYIIRDTVKVLGTNNIPPASFAIFYDDLNNPSSGGTGHTMNVCRMNNVPFVDQRGWFGWL